MTKAGVLIIGAGPTGLMAACQLAMRNIPFRIIDKTDDHTTQSRALVIHARTLEIFQQMGIAGEAIQQGKIAKAVNLIANGKRKLQINLGNIGNDLTDFPFLLILEQSKTEAILNKHLNSFSCQVERNLELNELLPTQNGALAVLQHKTGEKEIIEADWVIGADGGHSKVREYLKIPFLGKTYEQSLFVLDCKVNLNFPSDEMYLSFSAETFAGFFPMTNGRCRVIGLVPEEFEKNEELTFENVNKYLAKQTKLYITLQDPEWISKYHSHHRVVSAFRKDHCFLAGDAAHIHSPVGAQGMNTGLQDAYNLSWKLALVIQNIAEETLLDTYEEERIKIAKRLVKSTDRVFNIVSSKKKLPKIYRARILPTLLSIILPIVQKIASIKRFAFKNISNIALNYRSSKLSQKDLSSFNTKLKPGDRVPYNLLKKDFTCGTHFHLLLFSKSKMDLTEFEKICNPYGKLIKINEVLLTNVTENIYEQFGVKDTGIYLIRPDSYIAYRSQPMGTDGLKEYLTKNFISLKQ